MTGVCPSHSSGIEQGRFAGTRTPDNRGNSCRAIDMTDRIALFIGKLKGAIGVSRLNGADSVIDAIATCTGNASIAAKSSAAAAISCSRRTIMRVE